MSTALAAHFIHIIISDRFLNGWAVVAAEGSAAAADCSGKAHSRGSQQRAHKKAAAEERAHE